MSFISLDHCLFSLHMTDSYLKLNDPQVVESDMDAIINSIVNALFAVLVTLQVRAWRWSCAGARAQLTRISTRVGPARAQRPERRPRQADKQRGGGSRCQYQADRP